jgi:hypothetical protein
MEITEIAKNVIEIPEIFSLKNDVSVFHLLEKSGYFTFHDQITTEELGDQLSIRLELVNTWFQYSENKRSDGWFLQVNENDNSFTVGNIIQQTSKSFKSKIEACSYFIKKEIEDIRNIG